MSLTAFALLFSEMVQYCQTRSNTVPELQQKLHDLGFQVGARVLDLVFVRDRASRRETKLLNVLLMIKSTLWKGRPSVQCCYCSLDTCVANHGRGGGGGGGGGGDRGAISVHTYMDPV